MIYAEMLPGVENNPSTVASIQLTGADHQPHYSLGQNEG